MGKQGHQGWGSGFGNSVLTPGSILDMLPVWLVDLEYILPALSTM